MPIVLTKVKITERPNWKGALLMQNSESWRAPFEASQHPGSHESDEIYLGEAAY
jgi:hypothetical protein